MQQIPFNRPHVTGNELWYLAQALQSGHLSGDGRFTKDCQNWIKSKTHSNKVLLTHSATAALEMAAMLAEVGPGDEVIMPSYTFVSTANAFVLRGATPVFVDIRPDTLNLNELLLEQAITPKTKAIVPVHYAGVPCAMRSIMDIAKRHNLIVIEDAAQGYGARYFDKPLGAVGHLGCYSFHETKNIVSGEGGALLVNDDRFVHRADIIREKGTNRTQFFRGEIDKYTWLDVGSSYLPNELTAAFLYAQLEAADSLLRRREWIWRQYHDIFADLKKTHGVYFAPFPEHGRFHNFHMFYMVLPIAKWRNEYIAYMREKGIMCASHYVPLHSSPYGQKVGRCGTEMTITDKISERLVRLPMWHGIEPHMHRIIEETYQFFRRSDDGSEVRLFKVA